MSERIWAIPDIHGRYDLLDELYERLIDEERFDHAVDKLIFLGDMVDRGPSSRDVLTAIRSLVELNPGRVVALAGNHEWIMLDAILQQSWRTLSLWHQNGGIQTLTSFGFSPNVVPSPGLFDESLIKWMAALPLFHEEPGFFFSHAFVPSEEERGQNKGLPFTKSELIWTYEAPEWKYARKFKEDDNRDVIGVCGHIHQLRSGVMEPRFYDHYYFLDSGCGCSDKAPLVAVEVRTKQVVYAWPKATPGPHER